MHNVARLHLYLYMSMIKAIVFDCYGVLVGQGFWATYRKAGGDPVKDTEFIRRMLGLANAGQISTEEFSQEVAYQIGVSAETWHKTTAASEVPDEQLFEYIRTKLKPHYKLAVLSNANIGSLQRRIPADKLALFDKVIVSAEVGLVKPQPEIFELTAERLGVELNEMVFIDDLVGYVEAATLLGIETVQFKDFDTFKEQLEQILRQ
jgi:epoxide hydrolase-like predicted phosphatase